jgi:hypothetical protein
MDSAILDGDYKKACELYSSGVDISEWITITSNSKWEDLAETITIRIFHTLDLIFSSPPQSQYQNEFINLAYDFFSVNPNLCVLEDTLHSYYHISTINTIMSRKREIVPCISEIFDLPLCICDIIVEL